MSGGRFQGNLPDRTFEFAALILELVDLLPAGSNGWVVGKQLARSGTSVGANISEANHAFFDADFAYRCSIARKEASESHYWLRLCLRRKLLSNDQCEPAICEADELIRILLSIVKKLQLPTAP